MEYDTMTTGEAAAMLGITVRHVQR